MNMHVLPPLEFSRMVLQAGRRSGTGCYNPCIPFRLPMSNAVQFPQSNNQKQNVRPAFMGNHQLGQLQDRIDFLESEMKRMSKELVERTEALDSERLVQDQLQDEINLLHEEVYRLKSLVKTRDSQIEELDNQLTVCQSQLVLMKRRYKAAIEQAMTTTPGTIKHIAAEKVSIGIQAGDIHQLEERMKTLVAQLRDEKLRNRKIKDLITFCDTDSSVPPLPDKGSLVVRSASKKVTSTVGTCTPASITKRRPRLTMEPLQLHALIKAAMSPIPTVPKKEQFLEISINPPAAAVPFTMGMSSSPMSQLSPIHHKNDYFSVFEDNSRTTAREEYTEINSRRSVAGKSHILPVEFNNGRMCNIDQFSGILGGSTKEQRVVLGDSNRMIQKQNKVTNSTASTAVSSSVIPNRFSISNPPVQRLPPPPMVKVPRLNLNSTMNSNLSAAPSVLSTDRSAASEAAIKRAVAAAIEKRKRLAAVSATSFA